MNTCIFCKIISEEIPNYTVYEDDNHLAFLDINPNTEGVTIVIPKNHYVSNFLDIDNDVYTNTLLIAKKVSKLLANKFNVERVGLAIEGTGVDHFHIKLYPFHKGSSDIQESSERVFHKTYPGYLTTQIGPQTDFKELEKTFDILRN